MSTTSASGPLVVSAPNIDLSELNRSLDEALRTRIAASEEYTWTETKDIAELQRTLFPKSFEVESAPLERLRVLARLYRCEIQPPHAIKSHRKFIGPIIVAVKKMVWPLINLHMEPCLDQLQEFHSHLLYSHALEIHRGSLLEKKLLMVEAEG